MGLTKPTNNQLTEQISGEKGGRGDHRAASNEERIGDRTEQHSQGVPVESQSCTTEVKRPRVHSVYL